METAKSTVETREHQIPNRMMAVVYRDYGGPDVLQLAEKAVPRRLPGQLLVEVHAASVNPVDCRLRAGEMKGLLIGGFPRTPGYDIAGRVVDCEGDSGFRIGDRMLGFLDHTYGGAYAQYASCALGAAAKLPDSIDYAQAAAIPLAGSTALQALRDHGGLGDGDRVLINGASGGARAFAVQIAKAYGATVDAVASCDNKDLCLRLGADNFIDYNTTDFADLGLQWDIVFDAAGKSSFRHAQSVLKRDGRFVTTEPDAKGLLMTFLTWPLSRSGTTMLAKSRARDLEELLALYEQGKLQVIIDHCYPLHQAADAHRRVEMGVDHGKVVLINDENDPLGSGILELERRKPK